MGNPAGSIKSVSIDGRLFAVAADADAKVNLGGYSNEQEANGDRSVRTIKTAEPWSVTGLTLAVNPARRDQEFLQEVRNDIDDEKPFTITYVSGIVYQGKGTITDKLEFSTKNNTCEVSFGGKGELEQQ